MSLLITVDQRTGEPLRAFLTMAEFRVWTTGNTGFDLYRLSYDKAEGGWVEHRVEESQWR